MKSKRAGCRFGKFWIWSTGFSHTIETAHRLPLRESVAAIPAAFPPQPMAACIQPGLARHNSPPNEKDSRRSRPVVPASNFGNRRGSHREHRSWFVIRISISQATDVHGHRVDVYKRTRCITPSSTTEHTHLSEF